MTLSKNFLTLLIWSLFFASSCFSNHESISVQKIKKNTQEQPKEILFSVMQFNIWQEGTMVKNGYEGIVDEIAHHQPDFVTLSEVRNYKEVDFLKKLCGDLAQRGLGYFSNFNQGSGLISKHPILDHTQPGELHSMHKIISKINDQEFAIYTAHLDYRHYAEYLPRGYDGSGQQKIPPVSDLHLILAEDAKSTRPQAMAGFLADVAKEKDKNRIVILGGDFNEASHLDWTAKTKDLYHHNGLIVPWPTSSLLYKNKFKDSYRVVHPNELTHPGFTWVVANPWLKDADERDRIDFIYYWDNGNISPISSHPIGPEKSFVARQLTKDPGQDPILIPQSIWPSDHRAVITHFKVQVRGGK